MQNHEMVEAHIESLENQLRSKKPARKHMRNRDYGRSLTKFLISAVMRKNYQEFASWVGRAGRTFWKQVENGSIESELVDADGNELSACARSKLLKDLQEIAAVMVQVPRLESVCSWIDSNIDHVPAIRLSELFQQYPPREWGALALVSVPGATAASVGGHGARPGAASAFTGDTSTGAAASTSTSSVTSSRTGDTGNNTNDVAELSAAAPANEGRSSIRSSVASVGDVNGSQVGLPTGGGMGGDASSVASPDTSEQDRQMISTPSAATPSASGAFDMDMDSPPSSAMNMSSPSPTSHTAGRGASTIRGPVVVDQIAYGNTAPAPRADIVAHSNDERLVPTRITRDLMTRFLSGFARDRSINGRLRKNEMLEQDEEFLACSELVLRTIPPYPFPEAFVYRCIDLTPENALSFQDQMASGQPITLTERAFTFTCAFSPQQQMSREDVAHNTKNTYIAIRSRSGRLVRQYCGPSFQDEWEVLFFYGTKFRVLSFEDTKPGEEHGAGGQGRYRIVMEEVWSHIPGLEAAE